MKFAWVWPLVIVLSTLAVLFFVLIAPGTAVQPYIVMWFLIMCPGMAWVRLLHFDVIVELTLCVAGGLSIDAIVVGFFLYGHFWSPPAMLITLSLLTLAGVAVQCWQLVRSAPVSNGSGVVQGTRGMW
jgi:hypothetical protein